jgi:glycosyltransferase involved in cell wall biosynthesis
VSDVRTLLIVSHVVHHRKDGRIYAYAPYLREIEVWAELFPRVVIASPGADREPPGDCVPFVGANIELFAMPETGGRTVGAKLRQIALLPWMVGKLALALRQADAIHVRCPGNLGLLGAILGPLFRRRRIAKYAGQWNGYEGEPWTVWLQRQVLLSRWWGEPVTVYGAWPDQPAHVIPFFTSMMTDEMVDRASRVAESRTRDRSRPLRVLYSGRLEAIKRVPALLDALKIAADRGIAWEAVLVGGGSKEEEFRSQAERLGLSDRVRFTGALPYEQAIEWNAWADCLVLPSTHSEGWPKVVAEAMCYGLIGVAVDHGQVGSMLRGRGVVLKTGSAEEIADALGELDRLPDEEYRRISAAASEWSRAYSLDGLREAIRRLLEERWRTTLRRDARAAEV